jgi:hypothetical protein
MNYDSWKSETIAALEGKGVGPLLAGEFFAEAEARIKSEYEKGDPNSAGAIFVELLEAHEIDLRISRDRGNGLTVPQLVALYNLSEDEVRQSWQRGFERKGVILGIFRGEEGDASIAFDF